MVCLYFYDKHFFYNECSNSSEPQWEHGLFSWNLGYQNTYSNLFYEQYNYQTNSLGKLGAASVWLGCLVALKTYLTDWENQFETNKKWSTFDFRYI